MAFWVITGRWDTYIQKAFSERFGVDVLESRKFKLLVKTKATGTPLRGVIIVPICMVGYGIYIGVGLSALLGSTSRAMREPQHVDRASGLAPRFLCVYDCNIIVQQ